MITDTERVSDMALTITQTKRNNVTGTKVTAYVTAAFDNSYAAGGEAFDATTYVGNPDEVRVTNDSMLGYVVRYDATNKKLKAFQSGHTADDLSNPIVLDELASPLAEVAATTNLELLTVDLIISGGRA